MLTILEVSAAGVTARVSLNGVPVVADTYHVRSSEAVKIDQWAISGGNHLTVSLAAAGERRAVADPAKRRFRLVVRAVQKGSEAGSPGTVLAEYQLPPSQPLAGPAPITVFSQSIDLGPKPVWAWTSATPVAVLDAANRREILQLIETIQRALESRDYAGVIRNQSPALNEVALALEMQPERLISSYREFLGSQMAAADWRVDRLDLESITFNAIAENRLQLAKRSDGSPVFLTYGDGTSFAIEPHFAKIGGKWLLIR